MAKFFSTLNTGLTEFIAQQHVFFVATAPANGRVNLSPKGMDSLRVLDPGRLIWLNLTGSGNETAAHVLENKRMTLMWCAFEGPPLILRIYGEASTVHPGEAGWEELAANFPDYPGKRQIFDLRIESVQTSCGYAVPFMDYKEERTRLIESTEAKGPEAIEQYKLDKNQVSIDGLPTGLPVK